MKSRASCGCKSGTLSPHSLDKWWLHVAAFFRVWWWGRTWPSSAALKYPDHRWSGGPKPSTPQVLPRHFDRGYRQPVATDSNRSLSCLATMLITWTNPRWWLDQQAATRASEWHPKFRVWSPHNRLSQQLLLYSLKVSHKFLNTKFQACSK